MVTHDRYFLDNVCNTIVELDRGKIYNYNGNYAFFLEKKSEREASDESTFQKNKNLLKERIGVDAANASGPWHKITSAE